MRLGIDIGGTKTAAALLCDDGAVVGQTVLPSGRGPVGVVDTAVAAAERAVEAAGGWQGVDGIGACMPGLVDPMTGQVRTAVNLGVSALDLAGTLGMRLGREVAVDNDVKASALGAAHLHPTLRSSTLAYLNLGTGLAAGIVHHGEVLRGAGGAAGEIGHLDIGSGIVCRCGQRGCLETVASGSAIAREWPGPAETLFPAAASGDPAAVAVVDRIVRGVAWAVQALVLTSGAELVVIGGGLTRAGMPFEEALRCRLEDAAGASPFVSRLRLASRVELLAPEVPVGALGAALLGATPDEVGAAGPTVAPLT